MKKQTKNTTLSIMILSMLFALRGGTEAEFQTLLNDLNTPDTLQAINNNT